MRNRLLFILLLLLIIAAGFLICRLWLSTPHHKDGAIFYPALNNPDTLPFICGGKKYRATCPGSSSIEVYDSAGKKIFSDDFGICCELGPLEAIQINGNGGQALLYRLKTWGLAAGQEALCLLYPPSGHVYQLGNGWEVTRGMAEKYWDVVPLDWSKYKNWYNMILGKYYENRMYEILKPLAKARNILGPKIHNEFQYRWQAANDDGRADIFTPVYYKGDPFKFEDLTNFGFNDSFTDPYGKTWLAFLGGGLARRKNGGFEVVYWHNWYVDGVWPVIDTFKNCIVLRDGRFLNMKTLAVYGDSSCIIFK